jgi:hypothetical protein
LDAGADFFQNQAPFAEVNHPPPQVNDSPPPRNDGRWTFEEKV